MRDAAPLLDVISAGLAVIARSRAYHLLDLEVVQQHFLRAPDHVSTHPESGITRALYDCASVPLTSTGPTVRLVVATHAEWNCLRTLCQHASLPGIYGLGCA